MRPNNVASTSSLSNFAENQVTKQVLPYWVTRAINPIGGLYGAVNAVGNPVSGSDQGTIMNARALWSFSIAYQNTGSAAYLTSAKHAYNAFIKNFIDHEFGGVYWTLDSSNHPKESRKVVTAQAYAIYGLTKYYEITQDNYALKLIDQLVQLLEEHFYREDGTYLDSLNRDLTEISGDNGKNLTETCNQLHPLEAFTQLYAIRPSETLKSRITGLIDLFLVHIFPAQANMPLKFKRDWAVNDQEVSYGHNFEAGWLVCLACQVIEDPMRLKLSEKQLLRLVDLNLIEARHTSGSFLFGADPEGNPRPLMSWWPQTEASNALYMATLISDEPRYQEELTNHWNMIESVWIDSENQEWFTELDLNTEVAGNQNKADLWRCSYHTTRACFLVSRGLKNQSGFERDKPSTHLLQSDEV